MNIRKVDGKFLVYKAVTATGRALHSGMYPSKEFLSFANKNWGMRVTREIKEILKYRSLTYSTYEVTVPKVGKIFAFRTLKAAKEFADISVGEFEIWSALTTHAEPSKPSIPYLNAKMRELREFWAGKIRASMACPYDTLYCDDLILLEKKCG